MMNKKILSVVLSVFFVLVSIATVSVSAFSADDIQIDTLAYNIFVTVRTDVGGSMSARLVNAANTELFGIDSDSEPELINGKYVYNFSFYMQKNVPTGDYKIVVGNNVADTQKTFGYVRIDDLIGFYDNLEAVTSADLVDEYLAQATVSPVDLTSYNALCPEVLSLVNSTIYELNLDTGVEEGDSLSEISEKVVDVDTQFKTIFNDLMKIAKIANSVKKTDWLNEQATSNFTTAVESALFDSTFDSKYYTAGEGNEPVLAVSDAFANFKKEAADINTLFADDYSKAFDKATLMLIAGTRSYGTLKDAFLYFEDKGSISPDMANIDALITRDIDSNLWIKLQEENYDNCAGLIIRAEEIAEELNTSTSGPESGYTPPSGGSIDRPSSPSGSGGDGFGGGSSKPVIIPPEEVKPSVTFGDIAEAEWAREAIEALAKSGIISGKGDGKFVPNDIVTREEYVKMIVGAFGLLEESAESDFADVSTDRWSYSYIASANKLGIVTGDGDNFNPAGAMSRQDMAVIVHRMFEFLEIEVSGESINFTDDDEVSDYAKEAVSVLSSAGIINGMGDGTFAPKGIVTRAQAAKVIYGLMNLNGGDK